MKLLLTSLRLCLITLVVCSGGYTALVLAFARGLAPDRADGSLVRRADGTVVGSHLIAQAFTQPRYFWPRPSAVGFDASAAGGSNRSSTSTALTERARAIVTAFGADASRRLPADLAAASGSGLDPDINESAARFQMERVAAARGVAAARVAEIIDAVAFSPSGSMAPERIVNVLDLNLELDRMH